MKREPEIRVLFLVHTNKKNVTVHSVHSNLVKIHSKSPSVMGFCPYVSGFCHIHGKTPRGILPVNSYKRTLILTKRCVIIIVRRVNF